MLCMACCPQARNSRALLHVQVVYELLQGIVLLGLICYIIGAISFQPRLALISKTLVGTNTHSNTLDCCLMGALCGATLAGLMMWAEAHTSVGFAHTDHTMKYEQTQCCNRSPACPLYRSTSSRSLHLLPGTGSLEWLSFMHTGCSHN